jgi:hypothetical protein
MLLIFLDKKAETTPLNKEERHNLRIANDSLA